MQLIFLFPFIVLPAILALKINFTPKNYLLILTITTMMGAVVGLSLFQHFEIEGFERAFAFVLLYAFYVGTFATSLYAITRHFLKGRIPAFYLAVNFGFFLISYSIVSLYAFGYEDIFFLYNKYLGIQAIPRSIVGALLDILLIIAGGAFMGIFGLLYNLIKGKHE